ncbi:hypothetical protein ALQ20_05441 [Pseudomonas syringae pv. atrofaciens]|nr:hypothetical protein ALQ20_05441 [Pseudomonas syringae pv. atrofaciens]
MDSVWDLRHHKQAAQHVGVRVHRGIGPQAWADKRVCLFIAIGVMHGIGDIGDHFGAQQVIQERVGTLGIGDVSRDGGHIEPHGRALLRNDIIDGEAIAFFLRLLLSLGNIPGIAHRDTNLALREVGNVIGRTEIAYVRPHAVQYCFCLAVVVRHFAVWRQAKVIQGDRQKSRCAVEKYDTALGELFHVFRLEHQIPGIERCILAEDGLDLGRVIADAGTAPQIRETMLITGITALQRLEQDRVEVFPVGQLPLVEGFEQPVLDLSSHEMNGRKNHIVTGVASQQLCVQRLIGFKGFVSGLEAGGDFEILQGVRRYIVRPVVDIDRLRRVTGRGQQHQCGKGVSQHVRFLGSIATACPRPGTKTIFVTANSFH